MLRNAAAEQKVRPSSDGMFVLSVVGLAATLGFSVIAAWLNINVFLATLGCLTVYAAPQVVVATASRWSELRDNLNFELDPIVLKKLLGLCAILGIFGSLLAIWEFYDQPRFGPTKVAYLVFALPLLLLAIPYFCTVHRMRGGELDEYYHVGELVCGNLRDIDWQKVRHFFLGWFIKLFFFPLMLWELYRMTGLFGASVSGGVSFGAIATVIYVADVVIASAGYLFTLRIFGWEIRSTNPYWGGWALTLLCYYPFWRMAHQAGLNYEDGLIWNEWLVRHPFLLLLWGSAIVFLKLCWIYAVSPFGLRFSNLTNRGILTDGAFRWTKHPSYISKNLFWWLIYIPFVTTGPPAEALKNCLILLLVNCIYFGRARYEEKHLAEEPKYVAYAEWIAEHGLFARVRKTFQAAGLLRLRSSKV